jgi:DNA topoisomerase-3
MLEACERAKIGAFYDKGLEGASHHAVIPNVNTIDKVEGVVAPPVVR